MLPELDIPKILELGPVAVALYFFYRILDRLVAYGIERGGLRGNRRVSVEDGLRKDVGDLQKQMRELGIRCNRIEDAYQTTVERIRADAVVIEKRLGQLEIYDEVLYYIIRAWKSMKTLDELRKDDDEAGLVVVGE